MRECIFAGWKNVMKQLKKKKGRNESDHRPKYQIIVLEKF
jgi:hypothetical protein